MSRKGSKRGICVPWNFSPDHFNLYANAISLGTLSWVANWEMWKPKGLPKNVAYVPQCRTANEAAQIHDYLSGYASDSQIHNFIGFNEPDIDSQSNMSVKQGLELWKTNVLPMKEKLKDMRFGSPAVSNGPGGIPWLEEFLTKLRGIDPSGVDFIVIHYYGSDVNHFKNYVSKVYELFKKPIWVTEFACTNWNPAEPIGCQEVIQFMKEALQFLDGASFIEKYSWFGAMEDVGEDVGRSNGLQKDGKLSEAGKMYTTL
jgi:Glycosyl hydrolase catalytic core